MDALARADEALARARARANVVTPEDATSPMDAASTVQIPRQFIASVDPRQHADTESTVIISRGSIGPVDGWGPTPSH
jgi:hypothetical protein